MCKIDPYNRQGFVTQKKMKIEKSSLTKNKLFEFSCKKPLKVFFFFRYFCFEICK